VLFIPEEEGISANADPPKIPVNAAAAKAPPNTIDVPFFSLQSLQN
jgi:hypothetical protein